jgi:hypothetical protein
VISEERRDDGGGEWNATGGEVVWRTRGEEAEGMRAERAWWWAHPGCLCDAGPAGGKVAQPRCPFCAFQGQDRHLAARQG